MDEIFAEDLPPVAPQVVPAADGDKEGIGTYTPGLETPPIFKGDRLNTQVHMYDTALGDKSPGADEIRQNLQQGRELDLKTDLLNEEMYKRREASKSLIQSSIADESGTIPPEAIVALADTGQPPAPSTILEETYQKKMWDSIMAAEDHSATAKLLDEAPMSTDAVLASFEEASLRNMVVNKHLTRYMQKYEDMGWSPEWGMYFAAQMFTPVSWLNLSRNVRGGPKSSSILSGNAIEEKVASLYAMAPSEMDAAIENELKALWNSNPLDAVKFVQAISSYGRTDQALDYFNDFTMIPALKGTQLATKGASRIIKSTQRIFKTSKKVEEALKIDPKMPLPEKPQEVVEVVSQTETPNTDYVPKRSDIVLQDGTVYTIDGQVHQVDPNSVWKPTRTDWTTTEFVINDVPAAELENPTAYAQMIPPTIDDPHRPHFVLINQDLLQHGFDKKGWHNPDGLRNDGSKSLPKDAFATVAQWRDFLIQHEIAHIDFPQGSMKLGAYEDAVTTKALQRMGREDILRQLWPEMYPPKPAHIAEMEATARVLSSPSADIPSALSGTGKVSAGTEHIILNETLQEADDLVNKIAPGSPQPVKNSLRAQLNRMPSIFSTKVKTNIGDNIAGWRALHIEDIMRAQRALQKAASLLRVSRVPIDALREGYQQAEDFIRSYYTSHSQNILDMERVLPGDTPLNLGQVKVTFGDDGMLPYRSYDDARQALLNSDQLQAETSTIVNIGDGFGIQTFYNVGEDNIMHLNKTGENVIKSTWYNWWKSNAGYRQLTSEFQRKARATATDLEQKLGKILKPLYEPYEKLSRREKRALDEIMQINQMTERVPGDPTTRGMFYTTSSELEAGYQQHLGRIPTPEEARAYFAVVRASYVDYFYRVLHTYRIKGSLGVKDLSIRTGVGEIAPSHVFEGRYANWNELPIDKHVNLEIAYQEADGSMKSINLLDATPDQRNMLRRLNEEGNHKLLQPYDPRDKALFQMMAADKPIAFVFARDVKQQALRWSKQVNFRPGFHNEYKGEWFGKQARVKHGRYEGDTTVLSFRTKAQADKFMPRMEKARQLIRANDPNADAYIRANLPHSPTYLRSLFRTGKLDLETPFATVKAGTNTAANPASAFLDGRSFAQIYGTVDNELDNFYNLSAKYGGDPYTKARDPVLHQIEETGTTSNPVLRLKDADQFNPMAAQAKAMGKLVRNEAFDDYRLTSATSWVEEFAGEIVYDGSPVPIEKLRRNPLFYMQNGIVTSTDATRVRQANDLKQGIMSLMGQSPVAAAAAERFKQKLLSGIYNTFGEKYLDSFLVPEGMISFLADPLRYGRAAAYHIKLGLFAPVQLFVQGSAVAQVAFVHPIHGLQSTPASILQRLLRFTDSPQIHDHFAHIAAKFPGWTVQKFHDVNNLRLATGFDDVGGNSAWKNSMGAPKLWNGLGGKLLEKGGMFFEEGDRAVRLSALNTAYLKWAKENPNAVGKMTEFDKATVIDRARALTGNMQKDANARYQNGLAGNATQFLSYNARIAELVLGHELQFWQKARLVGGMAALWGFPAAGVVNYAIENGDFGAILNYLNPWGQDLELYALKHGVQYDGTTSEHVNRGMASLIFEAMTGEKWDFASRYGVNMPETVRTISQNFKKYNPIVAIIASATGPSGSVGASIIDSMGPLARDIAGILNGEPYQEFLPADFENVWRQLSSLNTAHKLYTAITGDTLRSLKGNTQEHSDEFKTEMMKTLLGVQDYETQLGYSAMEDMNNVKEQHKVLIEHMRTLRNDMMDALTRGDQEGYERKLRALGVIVNSVPMSTEEKMQILWDPGGKAYDDITDKIMQEWSKTISEGDFNKEFDMNVRIQQKREGTLNGDQ